MLPLLDPRVFASDRRRDAPGRMGEPPTSPKVTLYYRAASGDNRYLWSARRRHPKLERSHVEKPAADIRDAESRRAVLNRHQPAQLVHVEVRVGFLTQRKADEGRR